MTPSHSAAAAAAPSPPSPAPDEPLHAVAYSSIAITPLMVGSLESIHQQAVAANQRRAISGVLLYNAGHFMQYLEGPRAAVLRLYQRIEGDTRHRAVTQLMSEPIAARAFAQWHMGLAQATASEMLALSTASWLRARGEPQQDASAHSPGLALLLGFWRPKQG